MAANQSTNLARRRHNPAPCFNFPWLTGGWEKSQTRPTAALSKNKTATKGNKTNNSLIGRQRDHTSSLTGAVETTLQLMAGKGEKEDSKVRLVSD